MNQLERYVYSPNSVVCPEEEDPSAWASINPLNANLCIAGKCIPHLIEAIENHKPNSNPCVTFTSYNATNVVTETVAPKRNKNKEKRDRKKELARLEVLRNAEEEALLLEQQRLNAHATPTDNGNSKKTFPKKSTVTVQTSLIKSTKSYEEKVKEILGFVKVYLEDEFPRIITRMETTDFSPIIGNTTGPQSYDLALDYMIDKLLIDLHKFIFDKGKTLLGPEEQKKIKNRILVNNYKIKFKDMLNCAVCDQRKSFIKTGLLSVSEIVKETMEGVSVLPQDIEKLENKYRDLCAEYMGNEEAAPKFSNIIAMQLAFGQHVDNLLNKMGSNSQLTYGGGGGK